MPPETVQVEWQVLHPCSCHLVAARHEKHCKTIVKAWLCDTCGKPFVPKHWSPEFTTCQPCHYGF